jgi:ABC-type Na+ efflux pump permease subunit
MEAILHMGWFFQVQTIVPLMALVMGSAVVAEEIEDRTITYLFTRPIPRGSILLGRWLAAVLFVLLALGLACSLVLGILGSIGMSDHAALPEGFERRLLGVVLLGGAVYTALFASAGALFKRPVLVGLAYTFVVEGFLANLPGGNQELTVQYYLKSVLVAGDPVLLEGFSETLALVKLEEPGAALRTLALVLFSALALGAWRLSRREYVLSS